MENPEIGDNVNLAVEERDILFPADEIVTDMNLGVDHENPGNSRILTSSYTKVYNVFSKSVFGKTVAFKMTYYTDGIYGDVTGGVYVDDRILITLFHYEYPLCGIPTSASYDREYVEKMFEKSWPIYGPLAIYVKVEILVFYGFEFEWGNMDEEIGC